NGSLRRRASARTPRTIMHGLTARCRSPLRKLPKGLSCRRSWRATGCGRASWGTRRRCWRRTCATTPPGTSGGLWLPACPP
ncbi:MAG: hypothetical protein M1823_009057, partial [Watsoniomyces obsoletus]